MTPQEAMVVLDQALQGVTVVGENSARKLVEAVDTMRLLVFPPDGIPTAEHFPQQP